jgi:hypothetical protein
MNDNAVVALIIGIFLALIAMGWASYWFLARHVTLGVMDDRAVAQNQNRSRDPERGHGSVHIPRYSYNGWIRPPRKEKSLYLAKPGYIMVRTANGERLHRVSQPLWVDNNFSPDKSSQPQKGNQNQNQPQRQSQNQNQGQKKQNRKKNKQSKENNRNKQSNYKEQNSQNQTDWGNANNNQNNQDHQEQIEWENANNNNSNNNQDQGYQAQINWENANNQNNQDHQEQVEWENANNQDNQGDQQDQNQNDRFTGNNDRNANQPHRDSPFQNEDNHVSWGQTSHRSRSHSQNQDGSGRHSVANSWGSIHVGDDRHSDRYSRADGHSVNHSSRGIPQSGQKDGHGGRDWNWPMEEQLGYNNHHGKEESKEPPW